MELNENNVNVAMDVHERESDSSSEIDEIEDNESHVETCSMSSFDLDYEADHDLDRIVGSENNYEQEEECCSSVIWKIKNFSEHLSAKKRDYVRCPLQDPDRHSELYFSMRLYPKGLNATYKEYLSLNLNFSFSTSHNKIIDYELSIIDRQKREVNKIKRMLFLKDEIIYRDIDYPQFIKRKWIMDMKDDILPDDCLTIVIRFNWGVESDKYKNYCHCVNYNCSLFSCNLKDLFNNHHFSDVKLVADEQTFQAHKIILAARSPVFSSMFMHSCMQENKDNIVYIKGFNSDVVGQMLNFIYSGTVEKVNEEIFYDLLKIADMYDIQGLKNLCEIEIRRTICKDNAVLILILSDTYNANMLKEITIEFIGQYFDELKTTKSFEAANSTHSKLIEKCSLFKSLCGDCRIGTIVLENE